MTSSWQEKHKSNALAMEWSLSCTNPSILELWRPKSPTTLLFRHQFVQACNKGDIKAPNYRSTPYFKVSYTNIYYELITWALATLFLVEYHKTCLVSQHWFRWLGAVSNTSLSNSKLKQTYIVIYVTRSQWGIVLTRSVLFQWSWLSMVSNSIQLCRRHC